VRLLFRDQAGLLVTPETEEPPSEPVHRALIEHLEGRGASFWPDLQKAVADADLPYDDASVLAALWDLVWAGAVTNDSLAPLRALGTKARAKSSTVGRAGRRGPRAARLARMGPPSAAGRWSLVAPLFEPLPTATESAHARAGQLLERYGVLTREAALGEGAEGGFAGVYPVLSALEDRGHVRRGYFVAGLGAAQFALPGAVDRLRALREAGEDSGAVVCLAATDPAQPYGAALSWPESNGRPARAAGAFVVLADGVPVVYLERGGRSLVTFEGHDRADWPAALVALLDRGRFRSLEIGKVDGEPVTGTDIAARLEAAGFVPGYRGLVRRNR
jgi:ATP-dependent Lhr-like helicase